MLVGELWQPDIVKRFPREVGAAKLKHSQALPFLAVPALILSGDSCTFVHSRGFHFSLENLALAAYNGFKFTRRWTSLPSTEKPPVNLGGFSLFGVPR